MLRSLQPEVSSLALGCSGDCFCFCCSSYQVVQSDSTYNENMDTVTHDFLQTGRVSDCVALQDYRRRRKNPKLQTPVKE